jgi:hypothetical protein
MMRGCTHELSYLLKTDGEGNLVALVEQLPTVVVQGSLDNLDEKVSRAALKHLHVYEKDHKRISEDATPVLKDNGVGVTVGRKQFKITC